MINRMGIKIYCVCKIKNNEDFGGILSEKRPKRLKILTEEVKNEYNYV